jgi:hypothetical protein
MTIAVQLQDSSQIELLTPLEFEKRMGIAYLSQLEFANFSLQEKIVRRCSYADKNREIHPRQKWLGSYYAQELAQASHPDIVIRWIDSTFGYGVFTRSPIPKNRFVGEYLGVVRKRPFFFRQRNLYNFDYTICWEKQTPYVIDAEKQGNFTCYFNHSAHPNLEAISVLSGGIMRMIFYAISDIPAGAQLCFNYGEKYWEKRRSVPLPLEGGENILRIEHDHSL